MNIFEKIAFLLIRLIDSIPTIRCASCCRWFSRNDIKYHQVTLGGFVPVCDPCWKEINKAVKNA